MAHIQMLTYYSALFEKSQQIEQIFAKMKSAKNTLASGAPCVVQYTNESF